MNNNSTKNTYASPRVELSSKVTTTALLCQSSGPAEAGIHIQNYTTGETF